MTDSTQATMAAPEVPSTPPAETSKQEAPVEIKTESKPEVKDKLAPRFAALSRKEKELADIAKSQEARLKTADDYDSAKTLAKESPKKFLEKFGLTFDEFAQLVLNEHETAARDPKILELEKEVKDIKEGKIKEAEAAQKAQYDAQAKYIDDAIKIYRDETKRYIDANEDKYELIRFHNAHDEVWSVVEAYFLETGKVIDPEKAAEEVENYLTEQVQKITKTKKFGQLSKQDQIELKKAVKEELLPKPDGERTPNRPTLTQNFVANSVSSEERPLLSREESIARAAQKIKFTK